MTCPICSSPVSEPIAELFLLPTVTSDCRPWSTGRSVTVCSGCGVMRRVTKSDFNDDVYTGYKSYPEPAGRTKKVLDFISDKMPSPRSVLDIGCGTGKGLETLGAHFPQAAVFGYEPHSDILHTIRENVTVLAERPVERKFDLITLFHVLEHVVDIHEMLNYTRMALDVGGKVLIQVPYTAKWPFDLIIADHIWHFNFMSLMDLFAKCGFYVKYFGSEPIKKELTFLIYPAPLAGSSKEKSDFKIKASSHSAQWLLRYKKFLDSINKEVAIYGTAPAAAWAGSILGDKVVHYLDDDKDRRTMFNEKHVNLPEICELPVVAPFPEWQLEKIKAKNPNMKFLEP